MPALPPDVSLSHRSFAGKPDSSTAVVRMRRLDDLSPVLVRGWRDLAENSLDPQPFLDPDYLLPLSQTLPAPEDLRLLTVGNDPCRPQLACVFRTVNGTQSLPFPHLEEVSSPYIYRGGILAQPKHAKATLHQLLKHLNQLSSRHGTIFKSIPLESPLGMAVLEASWQAGYLAAAHSQNARACLRLSELQPGDLLSQACSKSRRKSLRQARKKLEKHGAVSFRAITSPEEALAAADRFLELEAMGWKGGTGTALNCNAKSAAFFREMSVRMAARGKALFGELLVGEQVIASSCNLIAGSTLFAFKIGWNPEFRDGSPGFWNEIELVEHVRAAFPGIRLIDSCSSPDSYLENLYPHRMIIGELTVAQSRRATIYTAVRESLRTMKRQWTPVTVPSEVVDVETDV